MIAVPAINPSLPAAQQGDAEAFCVLIAPHEPRLLAQALGLCRNATQAEDLVEHSGHMVIASPHPTVPSANSTRATAMCRMRLWSCGSG